MHTPSPEGNLDFDRGEHPQPEHARFRFIQEDEVRGGKEFGKKFIGTLDSRRGQHGRYFFKEVFSIEYAREQEGKHHRFQQAGVHVPSIFKAVQRRNGAPGILASDLSENGRRWVLSMNDDREIESEEYMRVAPRIPASALERISRNMVHACEVAAGVGQPDAPRFILRPTAFMLLLDPQRPEDADVMVADFGLDVDEGGQRSSSEEVLQQNINNAATFFTWMTGRALHLPEGSPYRSLVAGRTGPNREIWQIRRWSRDQFADNAIPL